MKTVKMLIAAAMSILSCTLLAGSLTLAENGKTEYGIVMPANPLPMEQLAVRELQDGLKQTTGADFKISAKGNKRIILMRDHTLAPQECALEIKGKDLYLKGGDRYGLIYAVYTFLEDQSGIRWFTRWGDNKYPKIRKLKVDFKPYRRKPAYPERALITSTYYRTSATVPFYFRNRLNSSNLFKGPDLPGTDSLFIENAHCCHTLFFFIPPTKGAYWQAMKFKTEKYYFKEHPEYFSLDSHGKRTIHMQLCFSNPGLRKELTRRFFETVEFTGKKTGVFSISAQDCTGKFCYCPACLNLTEKYHSNSGPLVDFLLELCPQVQKKYPGLYISTLAYRREQTEIPPDLKGRKMPDNFICVFATIEDDFTKPLDHPNNRQTLKNLQGWSKISKHVWMWYYPLVYGGNEPFVSLERNVKDIQLMLKNGATGSYFEHDVGIIGCNFFDLLNWLYLKLIQNPDADYKKLVSEYCDFMYGAASRDMQTYLYELDECTKRNRNYWIWNAGSLQTALTPQNLLRWSRLFDRMEKNTANDPAAAARVRDVRFMLDAVVLRKYREITGGEKGILPSPEAIRDSIQKNLQSALDRRMTGKLAPLKQKLAAQYADTIRRAYIHATFQPKKLSAPLDKVDPKKIREVIPFKINGCGIKKMADAAYGEVIYHPTKGLELPFTCGFYDFNTKKFLLSRKIKAEEIVPDQFHLYKIGSSPIGQHGYIWTMSNWTVGVSLKNLYTPGEATNKKYDIWLSIKFEGPGYSKKSKAKEDRFYIDRAVVVDPE